MIIKAAKRIFNSDKICRSYSNLNFGVTFFGTQCSCDCINVLDKRVLIVYMCTYVQGMVRNHSFGEIKLCHVCCVLKQST